MAIPGMLSPGSFEPDLSHTSILYYSITVGGPLGIGLVDGELVEYN
jgi:hypothetical protein